MVNKKQIIIAYIPVLHEGYRRFFEKYPQARDLYILGQEMTQKYVPLQKDIRALPPSLVSDSLKAWGRFDSITIMKETDWKILIGSGAVMIMPDEEVMRDLAKTNLRGAVKSRIVFDSIFLRWDKHKSFESKPVEVDQTISVKDKDKKIIALLRKEAEKSSDWWRRIGAAVIKGGKVVLKRHNHAVPSESLPYSEGDPRSDFHKGVNIEMSTVLHAEAGLIADAAKLGISLEGAEMYATTFPCPPCAKMIAYSGIKKIYYADGYGVLDAERILKARGVEIIFVKTKKK